MYSDLPPEVEARYVETLQWHDLLSYYRATTQTKVAVQSALSLRVDLALDPFVPQHLRDLFWALLAQGEGGITGSTPFWITEPTPKWSPHDLNTVVCRGGGDDFRNFLRSWGCLEDHTEPRIPLVRNSAPNCRLIPSYSASSEWADFVWTFTTPQNTRITLTETAGASVVSHLLGASHSLQTLLLTRNVLISLYPGDIVKKQAVPRAGSHSTSTPTTRLHSRSRLREMGVSPAMMPTTCPKACPGLLRRVRGGRGIGLLRWSRNAELDTLEVDAYGGFLEGKYAVAWTWNVCQRMFCPFYHFPRRLYVNGPPPSIEGGNLKLEMLRRKKYALMSCDPAFTTFYEGLLFATSCSNPLLVPVPLDHGLATFKTVDDLRSYTWIHPVQDNIPHIPLVMAPTDTVGGVVALNALAWSLVIDNGMTLYIFMQSVGTQAPRNLALVQRNSGFRPVHGDVLLMLEGGGQMVPDPRPHMALCKATFRRWWTERGGIDIVTV